MMSEVFQRLYTLLDRMHGSRPSKAQGWGPRLCPWPRWRAQSPAAGAPPHGSKTVHTGVHRQRQIADVGSSTAIPGCTRASRLSRPGAGLPRPGAGRIRRATGRAYLRGGEAV